MEHELDTIKERAAKLAASADPARGSTAAEIATAQAKLDRLLSRHGLTMEDLASTATVDHIFTVKDEQGEDLLHAVAFWILETGRIFVSKARSNGKRKHNRRLTLALRCTRTQAVDIQTCFDYYAAIMEGLKLDLAEKRKDLATQEKQLVSSMAHKYKLYAPDDGKPAKPSTLSRRELLAILANAEKMHAGRWEKPSGTLASGLALGYGAG